MITGEEHLLLSVFNRYRLVYPQHNFAHMLFFLKQCLGLADFFQGKHSGHNRFYFVLLNALDQIIEHPWFKNGASEKTEVFQIQGPDVQLAVPGSNSMDVVIDLVAGEMWPQYMEVLRPGGRYAAAGAIAGPLVELDVRTLYLKDLSLFGCTVLESGVFDNLIKRIEQGAIKPVVARVFALEEICEAQALFQKKQHVGKIVLRIN